MANHQEAYNSRIEELRPREFPMLQEEIYLDHAGTTLPPKSLMDSFAADMTANLYGNPHSASTSSQRTTSSIDDVRHAALRFFGADPAEYDLVFVANATAGIKLVAEAFRAMPGGFQYLYHQDSHTSLVGVREEARTEKCLADQDVQAWLEGSTTHLEDDSSPTTLFAYPAQSNMDGRRLPLDWSAKVKRCSKPAGAQVYTLVDAAALVATSPLHLGDSESAPDFVVLSFNKIFGFPNLGGLIVRRQASSCFRSRRYFGGGTVNMVVSIGESWHNVKERNLHEALEDGTLPIHSILALGHALRMHPQLYSSMQEVADHTRYLRQRLLERLAAMRHLRSGVPVCTIYSPVGVDVPDIGPTIAFNIREEAGAWVSTAEFEKLAVLKHFHVRTGGLCNPGGVATALQLEPWEMRQNFSSGFRCDNGNDIMNGKPTGVIRISLGAMSTMSDINRFADFVQEFYVNTTVGSTSPAILAGTVPDGMYIDQLVVYPIKSCGGFRVHAGTSWELKAEGLAWDREWCLVHLGTGQALSQKRYPRMALIKPSLDLERGELRITYTAPSNPQDIQALTIPLAADRTAYKKIRTGCTMSSRVCGEDVVAQTYASEEITSFFSDILGTPCALSRFPAGGSGKSMRHAKAHLQKHQRPAAATSAKEKPGKPLQASSSVHGDSGGVVTPPDSDTEVEKPKILLSNESPILAISLASLDALNREITRSGRGGSPVSAEVFRANVVIGSRNLRSGDDGDEVRTSPAPASKLQPYDEDHWSTLNIGSQAFRMLGSCRRCHMVCINQDTGQKSEEPFITLAKTRTFDGKVFFGTHMCWTPPAMTESSEEAKEPARICVGDRIVVES
ncbi:molybdenum cofactor sulfurase [Microdochium bolleyi]|uniref:Molybdenum cofactor sulfurase n=1 Tax=Microdochium bolleyi TaxID=196109 RepID=A0A136JFR7_9PEZI|nr:molybdenum cofactor sulfurase [Microdochium bolleyi]